jgi:hypothetical protein
MALDPRLHLRPQLKLESSKLRERKVFQLIAGAFLLGVTTVKCSRYKRMPCASKSPGLGTMLQGIKIVDGQFAGDAFDWVSPFAVFCGLGLLVTYATLGCGWLVHKTEGDLQRRIRTSLKPASLVLLAFIGAISLWTVLGQPAESEPLPYTEPS